MRNTRLTLAWADADYDFDIRPSGQLRELQELCDAGPQFIAMRLQTGSYREEDVRETLRLGLIGAGMAPSKALALVKRYVDPRPLQENLGVAQAILLAAIVGVADDVVDDPAGERVAEETAASPAATEKSPSPQSTDGAPS